MVDALGNPVGFFLSGGQAHDLVGADHLLPSMEADQLIADKAFDADERVRAPLARAGKTAVIPAKANRREDRPFDRDLYKARHLIENFFAKSLFRNSTCVGERVATAPGIARKHPDQLVASTSLAKRRLQLNKRSTGLPLRSCSSRAPCTRAMNSETDS